MKVLASTLALAVLVSVNVASANSSPHPVHAEPKAAATAEEAKEIEIKAPFLPPMERAKDKVELMPMRSNLIRGL